VPGEHEYKNKGVAYCPHCDGPLFKGKRVAVIGGGNSGVEAAIDLAGIVGHVTLVEFDTQLRADAVLQRKLKSLPNVDVFVNAQTTEITGDGQKVNGLVYKDRATNESHAVPLEGVFIHPVSDPAVIAGNGTVGVEILEDLPDVDAIVVPFGGGGQSCGIAAAMRELAPRVRVWAAEVDTASPLAASLAAGEPRAASYTPSFVDGIGAKSLLAEMWPMARDLLAGSQVVSLAEIASAIRLLVERVRVVAEGAGAASVAAALSGRIEARRIACVVSGGNIDLTTLRTILAGAVPGTGEALTSSARTAGPPR